MRSSEGFVFVRRGLHLYYHVLGDGPETVLIPNANWLAELLHPLAEGRRLILFDPRSRGRSSAVTDGRQTLSQQFAALIGGGAECCVVTHHPGLCGFLIRLNLRIARMIELAGQHLLFLRLLHVPL